MSSSEESKHDPESGRTVEKQSFLVKCQKEVDTKHAYIPMLVCCFVSGLTDGTIYNGTLGRPFCNLQKGSKSRHLDAANMVYSLRDFRLHANR